MLVLASASPRRAMLLREGGYSFVTVKASVSEVLAERVVPEIGVRQLATRKAQVGMTHWLKSGGDTQDIVLGADTMVVLNDQILGKPTSPEEAVQMLENLSGRTHEVLTGVSLVSGSGRFMEDVVKTIVHFRQLEADEIMSYVVSGEPMDKAGAYGIQGEAGRFVTSIQGSLTNVIGLPMEYLTVQLKAWGIEQTNITSREVNDGLSTFEGFTGRTSTP
ncbi:Maf family protein [Desulfosporosinus sp. I2]|uniref:Maf family protein n=1 Tax=Desulfosporosinus sp. I2 TaxID=1617025 RepID=UPI0005EF1328|nr:Maf family protein [Desulfosporosinus sp. I2]